MSQLPIFLIALLWLNSLVSQLLLARSGQPVSFIAFIWWTLVYAGICFGLWRRARLAYWCAVVLSILQLLPAILWTARAMPLTWMQGLPSWYPVPLWIAFVLGVALFLSLAYYRRRGDASVHI
jgi:hypothetical protein